MTRAQNYVLKNVNLYGEITDITVENGFIAAIEKTDKQGRDLAGLKVYPGLIDVHSHGCLGMEITDEDADVEKMADYYLEHGVSTWYPTSSTCSREALYAAAGKNFEFGHGANIPGIHAEGPFISPAKKGAQDPNYITTPKLEWIRDLPAIKRVTVAPEIPGAKAFIENCPVQVTLGHTDAGYDTVMGAFRAGANCLTHTFNAMNGIHHRAPGPIGAASDTEGVYCELICDGFHIHPSAVRMLAKIIGTDRVVLISDMVRSAGLPDGVYGEGNGVVYVKNGETRLADGTIAGSTTDLFRCVKKAIEFGFDEAVAVMMASENPARMMGINKGKIAVGYDADFLIVDDNFDLVEAIACGR